MPEIAAANGFVNVTPKNDGLSSIAAACGETADPTDGVAQGEPRCERIAGRKRRHVVFADVPGSSKQRANQAARKTPPACSVLMLKISRGLAA